MGKELKIKKEGTTLFVKLDYELSTGNASSLQEELKLYGNARYTSLKLMQMTDFSQVDKDGNFLVTETKLDGTFVMDAGLKYDYANRLTLALDCENLLNADRFLTGPSQNLYMYAYHERGRNLMVSASYTF